MPEELTSFRSRIQVRLQHGLIPPDSRVLLYVSLHLDIVVEGEEAPEQCKGLLGQVFGHAVVLDIEEATLAARVPDLAGDALSRHEGPAV